MGSAGEGTGGRGDISEEGQKVQIFSYKINKSWGCDVQHVYVAHNLCFAYLKVAKRGDFKSSHLM